MQVARDFYKVVRWRLLPVRYAGKLRASMQPRPGNVHRLRELDPVVARGFAPGPTISAEDLAAIHTIYDPRIAEVSPTRGTHPFVNLIRAEDLRADNPIVRLALSPAVLDRADDYFGGALLIDSIQLLYSWPTEGPLLESQMWHRDYGDTKSFHWIAYVNDVLTEDAGPFGFIDKQSTRRIRDYPIIRRIPDSKFDRELGDGEKQVFYGKAGESVFVDPAACYHYGSRCKSPRLAIFVTFNTDRPMTPPTPPIRENRAALIAAATALRPDLSVDYVNRLFGA